jgi:hypothetical protein
LGPVRKNRVKKSPRKIKIAQNLEAEALWDRGRDATEQPEGAPNRIEGKVSPA